MSIPKLLALDIDGVVATKGKPHDFMVTTLNALKEKNIFFTVATGRGYPRVQECFGEVLSTNCQMVVENGGRLTDSSGVDLHQHPIELAHLEAIRHILSPELINGADFYQLSDHRYVPLSLDDTHTEFLETFLEEKYKLPTYKDTDAFFEHMVRAGCCKVAFFPKKGVKLELVFPPQINWTKNEKIYTMSATGISKKIGVLELCKEVGVSPTEILIAGNDFNDQDFFTLPAPWRIAVGSRCPKLEDLATRSVKDPEELNAFLVTLFGLVS